MLPELGKPIPRHSLDFLEDGGWIWDSQPPLSELPPFAGAGLLCIANLVWRLLSSVRKPSSLVLCCSLSWPVQLPSNYC